jgi:Rrf2 family iron-sulfur cluster assembly transcriptional regulator
MGIPPGVSRLAAKSCSFFQNAVCRSELKRLLKIELAVSLRPEKHRANTGKGWAIPMFSRSAGYAVQALTYLAGQPPGKLTGAREIATAVNIPMPFLWKILRNLSQKKLVRSFKGVRGGYELARAAKKITVSEVLAASPDINLTTTCVLGLAACSDENACPLHSSWKGLRIKIDELLRQTTLADLARASSRRRRKLPS